MSEAFYSGVKFNPERVVKRRPMAWRGLSVEAVEVDTSEPFEYGLCAPVHMLIACERGVRRHGESFVEGLPRSTLHDLSHKLTFVPAGSKFHGWQDPRLSGRYVYFYIDPAGPLVDPELRFGETSFSPRLFFSDPALWETALKLKSLIGDIESNQLYAEALSIVLAHELVRLNSGTASQQAPVRGGLASWQQRVVTEYIEEHLAETISLATLSELARLSPHHFCRAFKQSLGVPPHRYHTSCRMERAKALLVKPALSVTDVAIQIGFSETSAFTSAFRRYTGQTPTAFRRVN